MTSKLIAVEAKRIARIAEDHFTDANDTKPMGAEAREAIASGD